MSKLKYNEDGSFIYEFDQNDDAETFFVRKNKATGKMFLEFDDKTLISPSGREIELDEDRFDEPEEARESDLTEKQLQVYQNMTKAQDAEATEEQKRLKLQKKLFGRLRQARYALAKKRNVPAFVIFEDKTLIEMSQIMPDSKSSMMHVWGMGPEKFKWYGNYFLEVVTKFKRDFGLN